MASTPGDVAALPRLWGGHLHLATVIVYAPSLPHSLVERVQERCETLVGHCQAGATIVDGVILVRVLAEQVWHAHEAVYTIWETVRPAIAGKPARRIRKP